MDPAGIRELYLVRPYTHNPYQVEYACRALPYKTRAHGVYSINPWLPLSEPLTQRVSRASEGYAGWLQYDCAVIAGTDLESGTERDVQHLRSALQRGLPLMLCGGMYGLGSSYRLWHDIEDALPAHIPARETEACGEAVVRCSDHPVLRGLPYAFGTVDTVHPVAVHDDAEVLLSAGAAPVLIASERFGGRQLVMAVGEAKGLCCDGLSGGGFYGHAFYADLMRNCLTWLMGVETPLWFESLGLEMDGSNRSVSVHAKAGRAGSPPGALMRCSVFAVDEARLASGGDTRRLGQLTGEARPLGSAATAEAFAVKDSLSGHCSGVYEVELTLEMDNPPLTPPPQCFGMHMAPGWTNWKGQAVDVRRFFVRFPDTRNTRVHVPGRNVAVEKGSRWSIVAEADDLVQTRLTIRDSAGGTVADVEGTQGRRQELEWTATALADGQYTAVLEARRGDGCSETFSYALQYCSVPPPDDAFHIVSHAGGGVLNDDECAALLETNLHEWSLDTISRGILGHARQLWDGDGLWADQPFDVRRTRWVDAMVAARGRHLWGDFDQRLVLLPTHGHGPAEGVPCVHDPGYAAAVEADLEPKLRLMARRTGLISSETVDEPHLLAEDVCRCDTCLRMYRDRYGEEMPEWNDVVGDRTAKRWHLFEWLEDYTTRAFAATRETGKRLTPGVRIHNVAIDRLFSSNFMFNGMHRWAEHGDELYMACYPWAYLLWRGLERMPHAQTHWIAAWIRGLAEHYGLRWGVFMELWEHDAPNREMPAYWPVAQFYSLLAEGVDRMDTFFVSFQSEVFGVSFQRLREFGSEVNKVRPFFNLLARTHRPRAPLAFVNPWAQWVMDPRKHYLPPGHEGYGYYRRYAVPFDELYPNDNRRMLAYELFHRAFGDIDQVDEQLLREAPLDYGAVVVSDCTFLMRRTAQKLSEFVQSGGLLVLDRIPDRDELGERLGTLRELCGGEPRESGTVAAGLSYELFEAGQGRVLLYSASLQETYAAAVSDGRAGAFAAMENTLSRLLAACGMESRCTSSNGDVDAGMRVAEDVCLVPVANTSPERRSATITLRRLPFEPTHAVDLTGGADTDLARDGNMLQFSIELGGYHGALVALRPSPADAQLT